MIGLGTSRYLKYLKLNFRERKKKIEDTKLEQLQFDI